MTTLTDTELGASGNFINLGSPAALDNLGTRTHIFFCHPTTLGGGNFGYIYAKTPSGSINGERIFLTGSSGFPRWSYGLSSGTNGFPARNSVDDAAVLNRDQLVAITFDGTLLASGIHLYAEVADASGVLTGVLAEVSASVSGTGADGTGTLYDDSAIASFLMNRQGLGREFVGTVYWHGLWDHVKDLTAINAIAADYVAGTGGPLDETTGLVLFWANKADLSPNALTASSRSTYAAGSLPDYTELGGAIAISGTLSAQLDGIDADFTGTASEAPAGDAITGTFSAQLDGITVAATGATARFFDDFDTSCIRIAGSTITGVGDAAVFSADQRNILSQAAPASARWLQSVFEIRGGIAGLKPIIEFQDYATWHPKISGTDWQSTRRLWYREWLHDTTAWGSWAQFGGTPTVGASTVRYQHSVAFASYRAQLATTIPYSVEDDEAFLDALAVSYPNAIKNAASNTDGFKSLEYSSQTTDLGEATGTEFSLSAVIDDDNQTNPSGAKGDFTINAGVHAGEHQGKRAQRAFVLRLMEDETKANFLRSVLRFHVRPTLNPIGGDHGHWRGDWSIAPGETTQTTDLNRVATDSAPSNELITNFQLLNTQDYAGRPVQHGMIDFHGSFGSSSATKFAGFYNIDEITTLDKLRDRLETYLGAGEIVDFGASSVDSVEHAYRTVWSAPLSVTLELAEQVARTDEDFDGVADALVQSLYDMIQAGEWHFNVGTFSAQLDGISASFTGTASDVPGISGTFAATLDGVTAAFTGTTDASIAGSFSATLDGITAAFTGTTDQSISGTFSAVLDGISASFAGTASESAVWSIAAPASTTWTVQ